ncbi:hypothetical protein RHMOL_Rhmol04G0344900 [Rhododendron molle]|uniref:Uncharacterized protein n=1 Tax=Rhododendron molle TaxID=49168 RepID=A0ACC0P8K7_RHOML|nr:hypothetical protein RHMOL_Rhmol04G0344900 [Rhododendron molle]
MIATLHSSGVPWNIIFLFAIWHIWLDRNQWLFEHTPNLNSNSSSTNICADSSLKAEIWALGDGLVLARDENIQRLEIEVDAITVLQISDTTAENHPLGNLLFDCRCIFIARHIGVQMPW